MLKELLVSHTAMFGLLDTHLRRAAYDLSQDWIAATRQGEIPVAVVNISSLSPCPTQANPSPRQALESALAAVLREDPAAVAIDIDFSPGKDLSCENPVVGYSAAGVPKDCTARNPSAMEWTDRGGPPFFQYCLNTKQRIFLGVYRQQYHSSDQWLGGESYAPLAASLLVPPEGLEPQSKSEEGQQARLYMGRYVKGCDKLDSVSEKLAAAYGRDERPLLRRLVGNSISRRTKARLIGSFLESERGPRSTPFAASIFLVDFSALKSLEDDQATFADGVLTKRGSLTGKLVVMGYTNINDPATDKFIAPGEQKQAAGVFWHACGADTLIRGALLQPTPLGGLVLDLTLYLPIVGLITMLNLFVTEESHRETVVERVESIATKVLALLIFLCGTYFIGRLRIIWADFLIVAVVVLIHPALEHYLSLCSGWLWKKIEAL